MERARQKLHSRRGASILLALLLFLVGSMVSAVVVSASLTAAKRVQDDRAEEQAYLSVSSAAKLLKDCLERSRFTVTTVTTAKALDGMPYGEPTTETTEVPTDPLGAALLTAYKTPGSYPLILTPDSDAVDTVTVGDFTVTFVDGDGGNVVPHYKISGTLTVSGGGADAQKVFLSATFTVETSTATESEDVDATDTNGNPITLKQTVLTKRETMCWGSVGLSTLRK